MKKKSSLSSIFLIVVVFVAAYGIYRWYVVPFLQKRALNDAFEKGSEAVINKFEDQQEEIQEDLEELLKKIDHDMESEEVDSDEAPSQEIIK